MKTNQKIILLFVTAALVLMPIGQMTQVFADGQNNVKKNNSLTTKITTHTTTTFCTLKLAPETDLSNCTTFGLNVHNIDLSGANMSGSNFRNAYLDRKSTRLNSSHMSISYAVFC